MNVIAWFGKDIVDALMKFGRSTHDTIGAILALLVILSALLLIVMIVWGVYVAIDSWFRPLQEGIGTIVRRTFTPAHTRTVMVYNSVLKTSTPHTHRVPDRWSVEVEIQQQIDTTTVTHEQFNSMPEGTSVRVTYVLGRFSSALYVRKVE